MLGGYRQGSGISKSGYYKGIYCGSTYELCWAIYSLDHNVKFSRFPSLLEKDGVKYFPDFLLDDKVTIIELKGYEKEDSVNKKTKLAEILGFKVGVLRKDDLKDIFEYVTINYKTKKYYELYDDYKPKYSYKCAYCEKDFFKDKKLKTEKVCCNRLCSGVYRFSINKEKMHRDINSVKRFKGKLRKEEDLEIYTMKGVSLQNIASEFNIKKAMVWLIKQERSYKLIHD